LSRGFSRSKTGDGRLNIKTNFVFRRGCFGQHLRRLHMINIMLPAFTGSNHYNDGKDLLKVKYTEKKMMEAIMYTINHEIIHAVQDIVESCVHPATEYIVYNMIGNGYNGYFNKAYGIPKNPKWQKVIGGAN